MKSLLKQKMCKATEEEAEKKELQGRQKCVLKKAKMLLGILFGYVFYMLKYTSIKCSKSKLISVIDLDFFLGTVPKTIR